MNGSCYYESEECMTQPDAHAQCIGKGARLLEITSDKESRFIQERINASSVWLDLTRAGAGKIPVKLFVFNHYLENITSSYLLQIIRSAKGER